MNKSIPIVVLVMVVSACKPSPIATPTIPPSAIMPSREAPTILPTPKSTPTTRPSAIAPTREAPTTLPTSTLIESWSVYQNDLLGYEFSYPPQAKISSIGPDFYSTDDVPPDLKLDYFALLERIFPDDLCVMINYEMGFITIRAPLNMGGKFVTCGVTGVGDYDIVETIETVVIGGQSYSADGYQVHERDATATFRSEFFITTLEDGTRIDYGGSWIDDGATYEDYVPVKEILVQILASHQKTVPAPSCASNWSQLYPGIVAVVAGGPNDPPNRVRSAPDTSAKVITQIDPGQVVVVLEGPTCSDDLVFWKVESDAIPDGPGWTAEGDGAEYYVVPYNP